jgi:hypothetical protein
MGYRIPEAQKTGNDVSAGFPKKPPSENYQIEGAGRVKVTIEFPLPVITRPAPQEQPSERNEQKNPGNGSQWQTRKWVDGFIFVAGSGI